MPAAPAPSRCGSSGSASGVSAISICPGSKRTGRTQRSSANWRARCRARPARGRSRPRSGRAPARSRPAAPRLAAAGGARRCAARGLHAPVRARPGRGARAQARPPRRRRPPSRMRIASSGVGRSAAWQSRTSTMSAAASGRGASRHLLDALQQHLPGARQHADATASRRRRRRARAPSRRRPPGWRHSGASFRRVT